MNIGSEKHVANYSPDFFIHIFESILSLIDLIYFNGLLDRSTVL
jgi:hypothetical protein